MSLLFKWLESLSVDVTISDRCLRQFSRKSSCSACIGSCELGALSIVDERIAVDTSKCVSCGSCFSVCPVSAITGTMPQRQVRDGLFLYEEHFCPSVKEWLIYRHKGIIGILVPENWEDIRWKENIRRANEILVKMNLAPFFYQQEMELSEQGISRRALFYTAKKKGQTLAMELTPAAWRVNSDDWSLPAAFPEYQFYHVNLDVTKCTLCRACITLCPQKALQLSDDYLFIDHQKCTNCSLCEDLCREQAISVAEKLCQKTESHFRIVANTCMRCKRDYYSFASSEAKRCYVCAKAGEDWLLP